MKNWTKAFVILSIHSHIKCYFFFNFFFFFTTVRSERRSSWYKNWRKTLKRKRIITHINTTFSSVRWVINVRFLLNTYIYKSVYKPSPLLHSFFLLCFTQTKVIQVEKTLQCIKSRIDSLREERESLSEDNLKLKEQVKVIRKAHKEQEVLQNLLKYVELLLCLFKTQFIS